MKLKLAFSILVLICVELASANTLTYSDKKDNAVLGFFKKANYNTSVSAFRGFDEFSRTGYSFGLGMSYDLSKELSASLSSSYSMTDDLKASNPEYYGWSDLSLSLSKKNIFKLDFVDFVSGSLSVTAPTSNRSRISSLRGSANAGLNFGKSVETKIGKLNLSYGVSFNYANYEYESSVRGYEIAYSPYGFNNRVGASLGLTDKLGVSTSFSVYNRYDYKNNHDVIESFSAGTSYSFKNNVSASLSYSWSDRYYSNDSFLDDDKTRISLTLGYSF